MIPRPRRVTTPLFTKTLSRGAVSRAGSFTVRSLPIDGKSRVSVVIPKKIAASAVTRNSLRRRYIGVLEPLLSKLGPGFALIFFIQKPLTREDFIKESRNFLKKSSLI